LPRYRPAAGLVPERAQICEGNAAAREVGRQHGLPPVRVWIGATAPGRCRYEGTCTNGTIPCLPIATIPGQYPDRQAVFFLSNLRQMHPLPTRKSTAARRLLATSSLQLHRPLTTYLPCRWAGQSLWPSRLALAAGRALTSWFQRATLGHDRSRDRPMTDRLLLDTDVVARQRRRSLGAPTRALIDPAGRIAKAFS
jgi:hypothetical protein